MEYIDHLVDQELLILDDRISNINLVSQEISILFKQSFDVKSTLDSAQEYYNRKDYANAYKMLLTSLSSLININQSILQKYETYINTAKDISDTNK